MPVPFSIPASSAIDPETGLLPSEGWHDVTLTKHEPKLSKKQSPMMVCEYTIDNGIYAGAKISDYIVFGMSTGNGEARLLKFLNADGTFGTPQERWTAFPTLEDFVNQFPVDSLRAGAQLVHVRQINGDNGWESVSEEKWQAFTGQKNIKVEIADFRGAANPTAMKKLAVDTSAPDGLPFDSTNTAPKENFAPSNTKAPW